MLHTFIALLLAHALADFVTQTDGMARDKGKFTVQLVHSGHVLVLSLFAMGHLWSWPIVALVALHWLIDYTKTQYDDTAKTYLLDQAAHIASLLVIAAIFPDLWSNGIWHMLVAGQPAETLMLQGAVLAAGIIYAVRAGGFTVAKILAPMSTDELETGSLPAAGAIIGLLERAIILGLVLANQIAGVAFLIAAKSVLRFDATSRSRKISEYVLVGTLASVGWALLIGFATRWLLGQLSP